MPLWLTVLAVAILLFATVIAALRYQLAIFEEVEEGTPVAQRRSLQVRLEPEGATARVLLREHKERFPHSALRRKHCISQCLAALLMVVAIVALMTYR